MNLQQAVARAIPGLGNPNVRDSFGLICLRDEKILSFNGQVGVIVAFKHPLSVCVDGKSFHNLLKSFGTEAEVVLEEGRGCLYVKSGTTKAKLKTQPGVEFPDFVPQELAKLYDGQDIHAAFKAIEWTLSKAGKLNEQFQGYGIKGTYLYTCTGHTISRYKLEKECPVSLHVPEVFGDIILSLGQPTYLFRSRAQVGAFYQDEKTVVLANQLVAHYPFELLQEEFARAGTPIEVELTGISDFLKRAQTITEQPSLDVEIKDDGNQLLFRTKELTAVVPSTTHVFASTALAERLAKACIKLGERVDVADVVGGENRTLRFREGNLEHFVGLQAE